MKTKIPAGEQPAEEREPMPDAPAPEAIAPAEAPAAVEAPAEAPAAPAETAPAPPLPRMTVEQWRDHKGTDEMTFAMARAHEGWIVGVELTESEYEHALHRATHVVVR